MPSAQASAAHGFHAASQCTDRETKQQKLHVKLPRKPWHCLEIKGTGDTRSSCLPGIAEGHPEPLYMMECFPGNYQISRTAHWVLEGKVLSKDLHSALTGDSWGRRLGFAAWNRHISLATVFSWWLTGETMAHGMYLC